MKRIGQKLRGRLHSRRGESIAETLIAMLIATLAFIVLVSMVSHATKLITSSQKSMKEYYIDNNQLSTPSGGTGTVVVKDGDATVTLYPGYTGTVDTTTNNHFSGKSFTAYRLA